MKFTRNSPALFSGRGEGDIRRQPGTDLVGSVMWRSWHMELEGFLGIMTCASF